MRMSDLQSKKIISVTSGKNIGMIVDANILDDGRIESFMVEESKNLFSFNKESDSRIYWNDITKIGEDVILVQKD